MKRLTAQLSDWLAVGVGARSTNSIGCYGLSLLACTHTTYSLVFVLCSLITCVLLQAQAVACLALSTLSLLFCTHTTRVSLVCALFACLRSLAGCCLLLFAVLPRSSFPHIPLCMLSSLVLSSRLRLLLALPTLSCAACSSALWRLHFGSRLSFVSVHEHERRPGKARQDTESVRV